MNPLGVFWSLYKLVWYELFTVFGDALNLETMDTFHLPLPFPVLFLAALSFFFLKLLIIGLRNKELQVQHKRIYTTRKGKKKRRKSKSTTNR